MGMRTAISFYEFDLSLYSMESALRLLAAEELKRLAEYHPGVIQCRFAIGRGLLRAVLGQWLGADPRAVQIRHGTYGKPETNGVFFNLSHAEEKMILALSHQGPVGVDMEKYDESAWSEELEDALLSTEERLNLAAMPPQQRKYYFFSLWTMKEAYLKEKGCGLISDLKEVDTKNLSQHTHWMSLPVEAPYIAYLTTSYEVSHVIKFESCNPYIEARMA